MLGLHLQPELVQLLDGVGVGQLHGIPAVGAHLLGGRRVVGAEAGVGQQGDARLDAETPDLVGSGWTLLATVKRPTDRSQSYRLYQRARP